MLLTFPNICILFKSVIDNNVTHCVRSVPIRTYSGPHFPAFRLNAKRYGVSLHIQPECGKIRTRITPNTDTFHGVTDIF